MAICNNCGAPLRDDEIFCGTCGARNDQTGINRDMYGFHGEQPYGAGHSYPQSMPISGMAIASLVLGIATWVVGWAILGIPGVLGIIFGLLGMSQCKNGQRTGRGLAIAGFVLSVVMIAIYIAILAFAFAFAEEVFEIVYEAPSMGYFY